MFPIKINKLFDTITLIIFFNYLTIIIPNKLIFPFKTEPIYVESSKYIEAITNNRIYTTIEIGDPPQKINLFFTMETSFLLIANSSIDESYYNNQKSNTYLNKSGIEQFYFEYFSKAIYSNDSFIFQMSYNNTNNIKFNNIQFLHVIEYNDKNYLSSGYIGLQLPKQNQKINFFDNLKQEKAISSYTFYLNYTSDSEGYLTIGELISDFKKKLGYDWPSSPSNALPCENNSGSTSNNLCWYLNFNDIKFGDIKVNRQREAIIAPELGFIRGSSEYLQKIEENYFGKLLKDKCQQKLSENHYYYYECEKNTNLSSFKDLTFIHQDFFYNFTLTKDDLFKEYGDKIYFLIVFDKFLSPVQFWKLGKPFIKKYMFLFDMEAKKIHYYDKNNKNQKEKTNEKEGNYINYWIIIGILGICVIVMITLVSIKYLFKPQKMKAKELDEDFDYFNEDNKNNNNQKFGKIIN